MKKKTALVIGGLGQDGSYMSELLLKKNYKVICLSKSISKSKKWRHKFLNIEKNITYKSLDIRNLKKLLILFSKYHFDEIYNFAAQSLVEKSNYIGRQTININCLGIYNILECIKKKKVKLYHASSSEVFSGCDKRYIDLNTNFTPTSIYSATKIFGQNLINIYKMRYNLPICFGILFNHESPLRDKIYLTKKICHNVVKIIKKELDYLEIGDINIKRDWGYSKEYMNIIWRNMQKKKPNNLIIGTGKLYSIKYFIEKCFDFFNIKIQWEHKNKILIGKNKKNNRILIKSNLNFYRMNDLRNFTAKKTNKNYKLYYNLDKLIRLMLKSELKNLK
jgi:GDPmannose 4,6-dehydratase